MAFAVRVVLPDRLGHERHDRVRERQGALQGVEQHLGDLGVAVVDPWLGDLQVPVAEV